MNGGGKKSVKEVLNAEKGNVSDVICSIRVINGLVCGLTGKVFSGSKQEVLDRCEGIESGSNGRE
jgi:hypothetical protein